MAVKIKSIREAVEDNGVKVLVHGLAGAGKTVLCGTAGVKTLLISAEGGLLSLQGALETGLLPESVEELVEVVEVKSIDELLEAYNFSKTENDYEWIMLDSISEIAEVVLENEKQFSKDARQAYGNLITEMQAVLRKFRDLPNKNVLFTAKQQRVEDQDTGRAMYVPSMPGSKLHQALPYMFDEVFVLRVEKDPETKEDYRVLQTNRDIKYEAKDRSGKLEMFEDASLFSLMKKINAGKKPKVKKEEVVEEEIENEEAVESIASEPVEDLESAENATIVESNEEITIADKAYYWLHNPTGKLATTEEGDDITELLENPEVEQITKVKYAKLSK